MAKNLFLQNGMSKKLLTSRESDTDIFGSNGDGQNEFAMHPFFQRGIT